MKDWLIAKLKGASKEDVQKLQQDTKLYQMVMDEQNVTRLIADSNIWTGTILGITHVRDSRFTHGHIPTAFGMMITHSHNPNMKVEIKGDIGYAKSLRHIRKGEILTLDLH